MRFGSNYQYSKENNLKSIYLLKNHVILNEDEIDPDEVRFSSEKVEERHHNKLEKNSRKSSFKDEKEKIINFLADLKMEFFLTFQCQFTP